jgi:hypothetical protein
MCAGLLGMDRIAYDLEFSLPSDDILFALRSNL